jgi:predicted AlkP superfamily phosphohydrolase/phosphomutase
MKAAHPDRPARPLLIIGWDGATPELIEPWMADGTLPNLAQLARRGVWGPLRSLIHPLSPAAWTSAFTGLNPGRHGIWDFGHRVFGTYRVDPTDARRRHGATLWDIAAECGLRSAVLNVPLAHPAPPDFEGIFVPGLGAATLEGATVPAALAARIGAMHPDYAIDVHSYEHRDPGAFLTALHRLITARADLFEEILIAERPDLTVAVFTATDRVQHAFWAQAALPDGPPERRSWRFGPAVRDTYRRLDDALGRLVAAAGEDATVMVISDHGFGDLEGDLNLNAVLEDLGLLVVDRPYVPPTSPWERLLDRLPPFLSRREPGTQVPPSVFGDIDWSTTRAYSRGLFGCIWLNLRGREPNGCVEPGPQADELLQRITDRVLGLRAPDGRPAIDAVFRGDELYHGPLAEEAPDLVVVPRDYRWMTRAGREIGEPGVVFGPAAVNHSGNHRMNGVLVAGGPGIACKTPPLLRLLDVTPTALALLGIEVPRPLDGRPMDLLTCDIGWTDELPHREPSGATDDPELVAALEDRLRGLGYLADR